MSTHDLIFGPLNEEQKEAVESVEGPLLILAGAGSGKTRALTHRIAYLIERGVPPWQILAVTFTNKAAKEMKERIMNLLHLTDASGASASLPTVGTFHSVCIRMLRRDIEHIGRDRNFVIYDGDDQEKLMKEVLAEMRIAPEEIKPRAALGHVGRLKSEAISPKEAREQSTTHFTQQIAEAYATYQRMLREANALDFDDIILETVRLLHEVPDVLARYQDTWRFLHVDEYQDTNHAQYLLVSLLAEAHGNVCVIGDPDQSIYAFRGADIRNILEFKKEHTDAKVIKLERNYRSTQPILDASDAVIAVNPNRPQKHMWTDRKDGAPITLEEVGSEKLEAEHAIRKALERKAGGMPFDDQVILYRTNAQSRLFEEACLRFGVPYRIIGGVKFYARREVKDVLAYLYAILNPSDTVSLLRIINIPSRKIGKTTLLKLQAYANEKKISLWQALTHIAMVEGINGPTKERLAEFADLVTAYREKADSMVVSALTQDLLHRIRMEEWVKDGTEEGEERWSNVLELLSVMHKYDALEPRVSLTSFLEEVALVSEVDKLDDPEKRDDAITLMTVHLCKGLEFRAVTIAGCEEGLFPHSAALIDRNQLEEERRLMYVAMTRAKDVLHLLHARSRMLWGDVQSNARSRFLDDIPHTLIESVSDDMGSAYGWNRGSSRRSGGTLQPYIQHREEQDDGWEVNQDVPDVEEGIRISHPHFGSGTVVSRQGDIVEIAFDSGQTKRLALTIAPLHVLTH